ncbi:DUF433 domain-containing protein [Aerophototrophica crusticola]|uniref:DUF433 domain-containing protein n=1 Tax=Aerophototrophica crusticola TaxID=1709002 RepID=A0A858R6M8_9PROT|nr:DUF433 domain-containing protein [Rhodospirillaceae bacterium B3]
MNHIRPRRKLPAEVVRDPNILGGMPVIRGTRVPAKTIALMVRSGYSDYEIMTDYPSIDLEGIRAAIAYAQANPNDLD